MGADLTSPPHFFTFLKDLKDFKDFKDFKVNVKI